MNIIYADAAKFNLEDLTKLKSDLKNSDHFVSIETFKVNFNRPYRF